MTKTAAQLLRERRDAGLTAADIPKSYSMGAGEPEREALAEGEPQWQKPWREFQDTFLGGVEPIPSRFNFFLTGFNAGAAGYRREPEPREVQWGVQYRYGDHVGVSDVRDRASAERLLECQPLWWPGHWVPLEVVSRFCPTEWTLVAPREEGRES